jgi:agmatine deiminase
MISDAYVDVVYISDLLETRYPVLVANLRRVLDDHAVPLRLIRGTKDYWCRDYMPLFIDDGSFVQFTYSPDYLQGFEHLITRPSDLERIPDTAHCEQSRIILDGGNVVRWGELCIVTDKVFRENSGIARLELTRRLQGLLRVHQLIVIPTEPLDATGHADGVVRFLDEGTVAINRYSVVAPSYGKRLTAALRRAGLKWVELPYRPRAGRPGELPPAFGCYVNFLRVRGLIVVPAYGIPEDVEACRIIERSVSGSDAVSLDCRELSMGGACWTALPGGSQQAREYNRNESNENFTRKEINFGRVQARDGPAVLDLQGTELPAARSQVRGGDLAWVAPAGLSET